MKKLDQKFIVVHYVLHVPGILSIECYLNFKLLCLFYICIVFVYMYINVIKLYRGINSLMSLTHFYTWILYFNMWDILVCWSGPGKKAITALIACVAILSKPSSAWYSVTVVIDIYTQVYNSSLFSWSYY